jgi:hypothetical protein
MRASIPMVLAVCACLTPFPLASCGGSGGPDCSDSADVSGT